MAMIAVGAGQVKSSVAKKHGVSVIDTDDGRVETPIYSLDVLAIEGNGISLSILREAGIETVEMLIASTNDDEINIVACAAAKSASDGFTIAHVRGITHVGTWHEIDSAFDIERTVAIGAIIRDGTPITPRGDTVGITI